MTLFSKAAGAALIFLAAACQQKTETEQAPPAPAPASAASGLPVAHILLGEFSENPDGDLSIVDIEAILDAPGYHNQPAFLGPDQARFYYVAGNDNGKTDLWVYDLASGASSRITDTPDQSEFSPKPAPGGVLSYIQESPDAEMTRVHLLRDTSAPGSAVIENGPVGYYEWLRGGETLAVFYRSEPPQLQFVDVASGETRDVFANVGRILQASPDGALLFATRADDNGQHEIVVVDAATGAMEPVLALPAGAQDFFLTFNEDGNPDLVFSSMGAKLMSYALAADSVWHVAADIGDLGYGSITRIAVAPVRTQSATEPSAPAFGPIVFVAHPKGD